MPKLWKLVPVEPTKAMIDAAYAAHDAYQDSEGPAAWCGLVSAYSAMIRAAPDLAPPFEDGWQHMETAPTDGQSLLLYDASWPRSVFQGYYTRFVGGLNPWRQAAGHPCTPTHWRPLPAPPKTEGGAP